MADPKQKSPDPAAPAPAAPAASANPQPAANLKLSPEAETNQRITGLKAQIADLEKDVRMLTGKVANRDPAVARAIGRENTELEGRLDLLEKALFSVISESYLPRNSGDFQQKYEAIQDAAVEYLKKKNVDPELWKNIVS